MPTPLRCARSPDGALVLELFEENDYCLGFQGQAWHTHGDMLVPEYGETPKEAASAFFESVIADEQPICVSKRQGRKTEVWVTDAPEKEQKYLELGELLVVRFWSGKPYVA